MVHKYGENSRNRRDKPGQSWKSKYCIDQALKKQLEKMWYNNK